MVHICRRNDCCSGILLESHCSYSSFLSIFFYLFIICVFTLKIFARIFSGYIGARILEHATLMYDELRYCMAEYLAYYFLFISGA